jgi:hypothetical protein
MDRRSFLKGLVATAAGVLVPGQVLAEPERRVWALDRTMVTPPAGEWVPYRGELTRTYLETDSFIATPPASWDLSDELVRVVGIQPSGYVVVERGLIVSRRVLPA